MAHFPECTDANGALEHPFHDQVVGQFCCGDVHDGNSDGIVDHRFTNGYGLGTGVDLADLGEDITAGSTNVASLIVRVKPCPWAALSRTAGQLELPPTTTPGNTQDWSKGTRPKDLGIEGVKLSGITGWPKRIVFRLTADDRDVRQSEAQSGDWSCGGTQAFDDEARG